MKKFFVYLFCAALANAARIVALDPAAVEILDALGAKEQIVAIAPPSTFDIRADISQIPSVGSYMKPNIEQIYSLKPDIVLASRHSLASAEQLAKLGIAMHTVDANSLDEISQNIKYLANLSNTDASEVLAAYEREISTLGGLEGKSVMLVFSAKPLMLFCGKNLIDDAARKMGLKNACTAKEQTPIVSSEYIAAAAPDFIIYLGEDLDALRALPLMKLIEQKSRILSIKASALLRASNQISGELRALNDRLLETK